MLGENCSSFNYRIQLDDPFVILHARRLAAAYCAGDMERVQEIRQQFAMLCGNDPATLAAFGKRCAQFAVGG
jgi:hypothetical protein